MPPKPPKRYPGFDRPWPVTLGLHQGLDHDSIPTGRGLPGTGGEGGGRSPWALVGREGCWVQWALLEGCFSMFFYTLLCFSWCISKKGVDFTWVYSKGFGFSFCLGFTHSRVVSSVASNIQRGTCREQDPSDLRVTFCSFVDRRSVWSQGDRFADCTLITKERSVSRTDHENISKEVCDLLLRYSRSSVSTSNIFKHCAFALLFKGHFLQKLSELTGHRFPPKNKTEEKCATWWIMMGRLVERPWNRDSQLADTVAVAQVMNWYFRTYRVRALVSSLPRCRTKKRDHPSP